MGDASTLDYDFIFKCWVCNIIKSTFDYCIHQKKIKKNMKRRTSLIDVVFICFSVLTFVSVEWMLTSWILFLCQFVERLNNNWTKESNVV